MKWRRGRARVLPAAAAALLAVVGAAGCHASSPHDGATGATGASEAPSTQPAGVAAAVHPATAVDPGAKQGYFPDPYPVRVRASDAATFPPTLTGTRREAISCPGDVKPECFTAKKLGIAVDPALRKQLDARGVRLKTSENHDIARLDSGSWEMAVTFHMASAKHPKAKHWNIILHARPAKVPADGVPTSWIADSFLVGDTDRPTKGNYAAKYFEDDGKLYLVYSRRAKGRNVVAAQPMESPRKAAAAAPTTLLAPGKYTSEYSTDKHKQRLIESGSVVRIGGKYALTYSTGAYDYPKAAVAWSDTFLPASGKQYRKVTMADPKGVWGKPGSRDVRYLIQSMKPDWPNYAAKAVTAPGAPSLAEAHGRWYLFFAGFAPSDAPEKPGSTHLDGAHRRPFYAPLTVKIPAGASVAKTSAADLAGWLSITGSGR